MKKFAICSIFISGIIFMWILASRGYAADTTEAFDKGLSDFEIYISEEVEGLIGLGITDSLSLGFTTGTAGDASDSLGLMLFYNILDVLLALDMIADLAYVLQEGKDLIEYDTGVEVSFQMERVTPYSRIFAFDDNSEGSSIRFSILGGIMLPLKEGVEFLVEADTATVDEGDRPLGVDIGINTMLSESVELTPDIRYNFKQNDEPASIEVTLGFICTF